MLAKFDPSALPTAMPLDASSAALADTNISGAEVPIDTTVRPIMSGERPKYSAIPDAPSTKRSALHTSTAIPTISTGNKMKNEMSISSEGLFRFGRQNGIVLPAWCQPKFSEAINLSLDVNVDHFSRQRINPMQNAVKFVALLALIFTASLTLAQDESSPSAQPLPSTAHKTVELVSEQLLAMLEESKKQFDDNPQGFYSDIETVISPWVDFSVWTKGVIGPEFFASISEEQRKKFETVFKDSLIETYAKGVLNVEDSGYKIAPPHAKDSKAQTVKVSQTLYSKDERVRVVYFMRKNADDRWQFRNVNFEGIDLGRTFRSQFKRAVEEHDRDFDKVIANWAAEG